MLWELVRVFNPLEYVQYFDLKAFFRKVIFKMVSPKIRT